MTTKNEKYYFDKICRVCVLEHENFKMLDENFEENNLKIYNIFNDFTVIKVFENDGLPFRICLSCLNDLKNVYIFTKKCQRAIENFSEKSKQMNHDLQENESEIKTEFSDFSENSNFDTMDTIKCELHEQNLSEDELPKQIKSKNKKNTKYKKLIGVKQSNSKNKTFECKKCNLYFASRNSLVDHWATADHKNRPYSKKVCPICKKEIAYKRLRQHLKLHSNTETHVCKFCAKIYTMYSNLKRHILEAHENVRSHICEKCGRGFTRKSILQNHKCPFDNSEYFVLNDHFRTRKRGYVKLNCQKCDRTFRGSGALKMHLKRIHEKKENFHQEQNFGNKKLKEQKSYFDNHDNGQNSCLLESEQKVGTSFNFAENKNINLEQKNGDYVNKNSGLEQNLENNDNAISMEQNLLVINKNSNDIKFLCAICGRGFSSKMLLQSHSIVHSSEKPHSCGICKKSFSRLNTLEVHMRSHTGERPYQCMDCGKKFAQLTHLKYHKRTHTGEKPYECQTCQKRFSLKGTLTVHLRTHTGERPYKCRFCDSAFYDSSSAKKHERQNHTNHLQDNFT